MSRTVHIDPSAAASGDGSAAAPLRSWGEVALQAGDTLLLRGGTTIGGLNIQVQGNANAPVAIASYGEGQARVHGAINIQGASHVTLLNLEIEGNDSYGVSIIGGTAAIAVRDCTIHGGIDGILVRDAIDGIDISGNRIFENDSTGISLDKTHSAAGSVFRVAGNTIYRNGQQGISLHANDSIVEANTIVNNGLSGLPGASGIQVLSLGEADAGRNNKILNNIVAYQRDGSSFDGNGIQLDHYSIGNLVAGNQVFGNDGCGINLFAAQDNVVRSNIVQGNVLDRGGSHVFARAEIYMSDAKDFPIRTSGNQVTNNRVHATSAVAAVIQVLAEQQAQLTNTVTGNQISRSGPGPLLLDGLLDEPDLATWNAGPWVGEDALAGTPIPPPPVIDAALLDTSFKLRTSAFRTIKTTDQSILVASPLGHDLVGGPKGSMMAGDGSGSVIVGGAGYNLMSAGPGPASLFAAGDGGLLLGGRGDDLFVADNHDSVMVGGAGNDRMIGGAGDDAMFAGNGGGTDVMEGGAGENVFVGGPGTDLFVLGPDLNLILGFTAGQDRIDARALGWRDMEDLRITVAPLVTLINDGAGEMRLVLLQAQAKASDFIFATDSGASLSIVAQTTRRDEGQPEGAVAGTTGFVFVVTREGDITGESRVGWHVVGAGSNRADANDFVGGVFASGTVKFAAGDARSQVITLQVAGDGELEEDETFAITLSAPEGATIGTASAEAVIGDDDHPPVLPHVSITATATAREQDVWVTLAISLDAPVSAPTSVRWSVEDGTARVSDGDMPAGQGGQAVHFVPGGPTTQSITVLVNDQAFLSEQMETFIVRLHDAQGAEISHADAVVTILDHYVPPPDVPLSMTLTTTGEVSTPSVAAYVGPLNWINGTFMHLGVDGVAVAAAAPNLFLRSGAGDDALAVAAGQNVLDGGTGSNFLSGGIGHDTFFLDARSATDAIWSTVTSFDSGDALTLWGIGLGTHALSWADGQGAPGYTGLTLTAAADDRPAVTLTLADLDMGDLGRVRQIYGILPDAGTPYLYLYAEPT